MRFYRCKCGNAQAWGSMPPAACAKCSQCGSDYAESPGAHRTPLEHEFIVGQVETDNGPAPLSVCKYCHRTRKEIDEQETLAAEARLKEFLEKKAVDTPLDAVPEGLVCFGCSHSASSEAFPGKPSGERPCCFCIRNAARSQWKAIAKAQGHDVETGPWSGKWYDGSPAVRVPMDCYQPLDMFNQHRAWEEMKKVTNA